MTEKLTRNSRGSGTIRQRKDGTWEARFTVGRDPGTGKQVQKSVYGKTRAEAARKMRAHTHEIDEGIYADPAKITFGAWLDIWLNEYMGSAKHSTVEQYRYQIRTHLKPAMGAVKLSALTSPMLQKLYNDCINQKGLSPKSVRNLHGVAHKTLDQAVKLGYIRFNPCEACTLPRVEKKEMQTIQGDRVADFLKAIRGHQYEAVYFVTIFCGMRQGEVLGLTWDCVDFEKGCITINKQLQKKRQEGGGGETRFVALKNDKQRKIMPAPAVFQILQQVQRQQKEDRLRAGGDWSNPLNLVFTNALGQHLVAYTVYHNFKKIAESIGLPDIRFHDLRHTYATLSLQNGDDIKTVSENLGHATVAFTLDVYGHVTDQMRQDSANRMQALISAAQA